MKTPSGTVPTFRELLRQGTDILEQSGRENAAYDARELLLYSFDLEWSCLLLRYEETAEEEGCARYLGLIEQRASGEPLQYITGSQIFCGFPIKVNEHVLIPRQDTEVLVETVLEELKKAPEEPKNNAPEGLSLLDLCTGSGCIAVALAKLYAFSEVTAADLSEQVLLTAEENAKTNGAEIRFVRSDLFGALESCTYDIITCNPPYIPTDVVKTLSEEVRDHEPSMALDGGEDGLDFYRRLAEECPGHLKPGGRVFFEIGADQGKAVSGLLETAGFQKVRVIQDLAGLDRVVTGVKGTVLNDTPVMH